MSKEVDQRIVEMQFNNADFEQKVSKSISSLKQLKDASQMEDAGKGLDNLTKGIHNLDLSSIADGIEKLNARFSNLGIVGMTVMQNLTNAAMNLGNQLINTLTEAPRGGMQTYESFISATKQLKNSAKDAEGLPGQKPVLPSGVFPSDRGPGRFGEEGGHRGPGGQHAARGRLYAGHAQFFPVGGRLPDLGGHDRL